MQLKQHSRVTYLGCIFEETVFGESMACKVTSSVNGRLKSLHWKNKYLTATSTSLSLQHFIQPHFDYACSAWYPNLSKKLKHKIQTNSQNKCIRFCLQLDKMSHISEKEFETIGFPLRKVYH